jgi:hypothetical protein
MGLSSSLPLLLQKQESQYDRIPCIIAEKMMKFMEHGRHIQLNMDLESQWGIPVFSLCKKKFDFAQYE